MSAGRRTTRPKWRQKTFNASHVGMKATWTGTLDRLAAYVAKV